MHEFMREFADEFVDEFFANFVHEFKYEIRTNSYELLNEKLVMLRMACTVCYKNKEISIGIGCWASDHKLSAHSFL